MDNVMTNGFAELSAMEMYAVDGGGWQEAVEATIGSVLVAHTPLAIALVTTGTVVCTPVAGAAAIVVCGVGGVGLILKACGN